MNDEQSIIGFLSRSATEYLTRGNVHDAALTLGVKSFIERLIKERDSAREWQDFVQVDMKDGQFYVVEFNDDSMGFASWDAGDGFIAMDGNTDIRRVFLVPPPPELERTPDDAEFGMKP